MLLIRITLQDVGVYKGSNNFDFETEPEKPIALYGGVNGAGKTTLFESISLCLYGKDFSDEKITKKQYHEKIHRLFHKNIDTHASAQEAHVTLEFRYAQSGVTSQYKITRKWQNNEGKIDEFLTLAKKSKTDTKYARINLDEFQIQSSINQMLPRDIASMFFFDAEKIQKIVESGNENIHIKSSFDTLLGLDLPSQLYDDIGLYLLRNSDDDANAVLAELEQKTNEKQNAEKKIKDIIEKRVFLKSEINNRHKELNLKEEKFFKMGGHFAQERQKLINEKAELGKNIEYVENGLRDIIKKYLPLALVPDQLQQIQEELKSDMIRIKQSFEKDTLNVAFVDLIKSFKPVLNSYEAKTKNDIVKKLQKIMDIQIESLDYRQKVTFDFSLSDMNTMLDDINKILGGLHHISYKKAHIHYKKEMEVINAKLDVAPQQDEVGPMYSEIKAITLEIGEMEQELQMLERLEFQEKSLIVLINSKIRKCLSIRKSHQRKLRGLEMAPKIQNVLDDYAKRLRIRKIQLLESNILKGIQKCFHKDRLVTRISIDPNTYKIKLYQDHDNEITKEQLSKAELQMYATAIVWGLAKTSGRPLPFIIDTPLARLDEKHRKNMIRNFYPTASHQTIIFSTNTEIIDSYFDELKPYLSKAWLIQYDANRDGSLVEDGYFTNKGGSRLGIR